MPEFRDLATGGGKDFRQADRSTKPVQNLRVEGAGIARAPGRAIFLCYRDQDDFEDQARCLREFAGAGSEAARGGARKLDLDLIDTEHRRPSGRVSSRGQRSGELTAVDGVGSAVTDEGVFAQYPAFAEVYPAGALALAL